MLRVDGLNKSCRVTHKPDSRIASGTFHTDQSKEQEPQHAARVTAEPSGVTQTQSLFEFARCYQVFGVFQEASELLKSLFIQKSDAL